MLAIKLLKHRGAQTVIILLLYILFAESIPLTWQQGFYTISIFIKDIIILIMPLVVVGFIANAIHTFENKAILFIIALVLFEIVSNLCAVWYGFGAAEIATYYVDTFEPIKAEKSFAPLWRLNFKASEWWSVDKGLIIGLGIGLFAAFTNYSPLKKIVTRLSVFFELLLTKFFARLIPLFVLGFATQIYQMKLLNHLITNYTILLIWLVVFIIFYILILFLLGSDWSIRKAIKAIYNLMPAGILAFTSGCSLSTMPWTIKGVESNLENPQLAKAVIPATTNIQQIGDAIANCFLCALIFHNFHSLPPDFDIWFSFSIAFVLARFATAAMIGGAIFIMLPIYEKYLDFTPEMIAIILAFNVVLDPIITTSNVMANGALCRVFEKLWQKFN